MDDLQLARLHRCFDWMLQAQQTLAALQAELEGELSDLPAGSDDALEEQCDALAAAQDLLMDAMDACEEAERA